MPPARPVEVAPAPVEQKVLVQKKLLFEVRTAAVDDQAVYIAPAKSDRLDTLLLKDLSSDKRTNTDGSVLSLMFAGKFCLKVVAKV